MLPAQTVSSSRDVGLSAAIDQIHHAIERIGFAEFNIASSAMASQTKGRFKKFNQVQNVSSLGELREVFDNIILWILEGMQLIDNNQTHDFTAALNFGLSAPIQARPHHGIQPVIFLFGHQRNRVQESQARHLMAWRPR